ncbi:hypothetical protein D3C79_663940 [compost metagenome]
MQAFAARLVGATCCLGGLRRVVGDILGSCAHLVGGGGHLLDLALLLLHAAAGLAGDGCGLIGGAAGFEQ